jgi:OmpA-OmpF porin, OOP family
MRYLAILLVFFSYSGFAQVTPNPPIKKKSTNDTYVNKIEITEEFTILYMQFVSKSAEEQLKDYYNNMILQGMMSQLEKSGGSTISIQPNTYLKGPNGEKFKFIKAVDIPQAPDRITVEPDKKYFFKVYFEKLNPGIQSIDFIESEEAKDGGLTYWNFYGITVNNPAEGEEPKKLAIVENQRTEFVPEQMLTVKGKILDFDSNQPVQAKILCKTGDNQALYDSVVTSKTGYYEFYVPNDLTTYVVRADGYDELEQSLDLTKKAEKEIVYDIYIEKPYVVDEPSELKNESSVASDVEKREDLEEIEEGKLRLNNLYFETGKDEILVKSYDELNKLLNLMEENPSMKIRVEGHTDNRGDAPKNKILSLDRAMAVRNYLVSKGIESDRIEFTGYGDTKPLNDNLNEADRHKNRRVEIVILEK